MISLLCFIEVQEKLEPNPDLINEVWALARWQFRTGRQVGFAYVLELGLMHAVSCVCVSFHPAHARIQSLPLRWVNDPASQFEWKCAGEIDVLGALN